MNNVLSNHNPVAYIQSLLINLPAKKATIVHPHDASLINILNILVTIFDSSVAVDAAGLFWLLVLTCGLVGGFVFSPVAKLVWSGSTQQILERMSQII